jgi:hypothetical protein
MSGLRVAMQSLAVAFSRLPDGTTWPIPCPSSWKENTMSLWLTIALGAAITAAFIALITFRMASVTNCTAITDRLAVETL